jgi:tetratricopeptide (TPR) repeat protein
VLGVLTLCGCSTLDDARTDLVANCYIRAGDASRQQLPVDREAALDAYDRALDLRPGDVDLQRRLADRYASLEVWDRAWACLRNRPSHDADVALLAGQVLLYTGREQEGMKLLLQALSSVPKRTPQRVTVENNVGYTMADAGVQLRAALALTQSALRQRPDQAFIMDSVGWAHFRLGEYERAAFHLERCMRHAHGDPLPPAAELLLVPDPSNTGQALATYEYHLGATYARLGRIAPARRLLRLSLRHDPQYRPAQEEWELLRYQLEGASIAGTPGAWRGT